MQIFPCSLTVSTISQKNIELKQQLAGLIVGLATLLITYAEYGDTLFCYYLNS